LSNLSVRILVAAIGIPVLLLLTLAGGFYFFAIIVLISGFALQEYYALSRAKGIKPQAFLGLVFGLCVNAVFIHDKLRDAIVGWLVGQGISTPFPSMAQAFLIEFLLFVPLVMVVELFRNKGSALANIAATLTGVCYVSIPLGSLVGLRELFVPNDFPFHTYFNLVGAAIPDELVSRVYGWGAFTVMSVFASIWMCDSVAYFAGRGFGKHKLFERVSPKKTWEGAIAGFIGAVGAFLIARSIALPYMSFTSALICGCIVGVCGQLGDLIESLMKRDAGVKDSSSLIPGHGGVLDRFDSLIVVSPLIFFYLDFVVF
jgi:phosphatidate cytidylyltransferase